MINDCQHELVEVNKIKTFTQQLNFTVNSGRLTKQKINHDKNKHSSEKQ